MPFQSEKQRRYLWANEPEIARDWTDTYGSGIAKALGGRVPFALGTNDEIIEQYTDTSQIGNQVAKVTDQQGKQMDRDINLIKQGLADLEDAYKNTQIWNDTGSKGFWGVGVREPEPMTLDEFKQEMKNRGYLDIPGKEEKDFNNLVSQGNLQGIEGLTADAGNVMTDAQYRTVMDEILGGPQETAEDLYDSNFRYVDQKIPGINEPKIPGDETPDSSQRFSNYNQKRNMGTLDQGIGKAFVTEATDPDDDLKALSYAVESDEAPKGKSFLEKLTDMSPFKQIAKQFEHKPATTDLRYHQPDGSIRGWTKDQLDSMNALGGHYSEPMRQYRRDMGRIGYMLNRKAQGKDYGEKNLANLLQTYGGQEGGAGLSDHDLSTIGQKTYTGSGQAFEKQASKGTFTTPSGETGYYGGRARGGLIRRGYSTGGITRLLPGKYE